MAKATEYKDIIRKCGMAIDKLQDRKESWDDDETVTQLFEILHQAYWQEIHSVLMPQQSKSAETQIRRHVKDIITNYLRPLNVKIAKFKASKKEKSAFLSKYVELYDNFYAIAAMRSIKHYALYMEFDKDDADKVWKPAMPCFEGFFFYANKMVLDGTVKKIVKQYPTGYGKTYSDSVVISWIFGNDINADVLKMVGNPTLVSDVMVGVTNLMTNPRYSKVFPQYAKYHGDREQMFTICKIQQGVLLIDGSTRPKSMLVCAKDTAVDGGRFKFRFYDDITRSKDKENNTEHEKDWAKYNDGWKKRAYDESQSFEIAGGTAYSIYDFLSKYKEAYGVKKAEPTAHKYTLFNAGTNAAFISVPKLDYETDECTYPKKFSAQEARAERARDERTFMAMEQQTPMSPQNSPYYWDNLKLYDSLPSKESDGGQRSDFCKATLDLPRTGKNYASLGIFSPSGETDYLIDCFYKKKPLDAVMDDGRDVLEHICDKIISHKVIALEAETNTNSTIVSELEKRLKARGYQSCDITGRYSTENKESRIFNVQSTILNRLTFPKRNMYAESSDMGQFMRHLVCYAYDGKNDDSVDTVAMYAKKFLFSQNNGDNVVILHRRRG